MAVMDVTVRTRIATSVAGRDASDWARTLVETSAADFAPGDLIRAASRLRLLALATFDRAVLTERAQGTTWEVIAAATGLPHEQVISRYAAVYDQWAIADLDPDGVRLPNVAAELVTGLLGDPDPVGTAATVDAWRARHTEPWDSGGGVALLSRV